ncbi:MAG TPA: arginine--tRNA ligase, partial [Candidatus Acetothermia bacterium]|nr:arginine--tRNA ligase [Candidatus Acetothermia bacterium]
MHLEARARAAISQALRALGMECPGELPLERPRPDFGDLSTRVAFLLAKEVGRPPQAIAQELAAALKDHPEFSQVQAVGG